MDQLRGTSTAPAKAPERDANRHIRLLYGRGNSVMADPRVATVLPGDKLHFTRFGGDPAARMRITFMDPKLFSAAVVEEPEVQGDGPAAPLTADVLHPLTGRVEYKCELVKDGVVISSSTLESVGGGGLDPEPTESRRD